VVSVAVKTTIEKIVDWLRGVENQRIDDWLENDEESYIKMNKFLNNCAASGWMDAKDSPFDFADKKTVQLSEELYIAATKYFGGGKD
jgi:hypothetical protein